MERLERDAILLSLLERLKANGSWCGETHVQKATYFLQELLGVPLDFDFILYKHGPFSFDLGDEITAMRVDSFIKIQPQSYPYGPSLLPDARSEQVKRLFSQVADKYESQVRFVGEKLGSRGVAELERIATAFYVTREGKTDGSQSARAQRINDLKPHVSLDQAQEAVSTVDEIIKESQQARVA
jgi:hypothetical protein